MVDFKTALIHVKRWIDIWKAYSAIPGVLLLRYEDMMEDSVGVTRQIAQHLNITVNDQTLNEIVWRFSRKNPDGDRRGLHFNKAVAYRYRTELTAEQKQDALVYFDDSLKMMGFEFD